MEDEELIQDVRLLIDDQAAAEGDYVFSDAELLRLLALNRGSVLRAAAQALTILAGSEVRLSKKITAQDLSTDGPAVAAELRALAKTLRDQADDEDLLNDDTASWFEVTEPAHSFRPELTEGAQ